MAPRWLSRRQRAVEELERRAAAGGQYTVRMSAEEYERYQADPDAVQALFERQPLLSLHGHIHESGGAVRIGRTLAINAGSEYGEGVLRGVLVTVGGGKVLRHQATTG
jgi:hypothetical protein